MKTFFTFLSLWFALSYIGVNAQNAPAIDQLDDASMTEDDQAMTIKLTGMTDGDAGTQTLSLQAVSDRPGFFSTLEFDLSSGTDTSIVFQPAADSCGIANITVTVTDQENPPRSTSMTFAVDVACVNDPPTIDQHDDVTVNEDPPGGVVQVTLTGISAGPPNEPQGLMWALYPVNQAMIDSMKMDYTTGDDTGVLNIYIARDTSGTSDITVYPIDENGFMSVSMTFNLIVNPVNDAPTLDAISDVTIENDEQQHTVDLTGISEGAPNETGQTLTFTVTTDNDALFDGGLTVDYTEGDASGQLKFTPAAGASGTANVTVTLSDDGGTENGGVDETTREFAINITTTATGVPKENTQQLVIYPNPVTDVLNISIPYIAEGTVYEVYSFAGQKVTKGKAYGSELRIPVTGLSSGWYQIKVISGDNVYTGKFLVK